ncbi:hypothetical protein BDZ91DRAFT_709942 [Kalaharituber pfeilii]|nr:hypothetical protein BDZ91DRAFT_709942 [Kalaharituber pfeilii]
MVRDGPHSSSYHDEFPLLKSNGLYAADISGDGDCLFHALSDQLYGHEDNHAEIRARVVSHMCQHADYFKLFLDVPGPTTRSNKQRSAKSAGAIAPPSEAAIDAAFAAHTKRMAQSGVYGDNIEICAFAREYNCDVKIYQREFAYVVTGGMQVSESGQGERKMVHIAYHTWEHYSSIRNLAGPHMGLPNVTPVIFADAGTSEAVPKGRKGKATYALPWMVHVVMKSLPYLATEEEISKYLEECKGDVNEAVGRMLDKENVYEGEGGVEEEAEAVNGINAETNGKEPSDGKAPNEDSVASPDAADSMAIQGPGKPKKGNKKSAQQNPQSKQKPNNASENKTPKNPASKPKKETARERKERQKAQALANKKLKGSNGGASNVKSGSKAHTNENGTDGTIRELYI